MTNTVDIRQATKLELLEEKLSLLLKIKDLTAAADISGSDAEERYITLISRREAIIKQVRALDARLAGYAPENGEHKLLGLIRETSERILEMDSEISRRVPGMMQGIKKRIKQVKDGRVINRAYHTEMYGIVAGSSFNHKQ